MYLIDAAVVALVTLTPHPQESFVCGVQDHEVQFRILADSYEGVARITYRVAPRDNLTGITNANVEAGVDDFCNQMEAEFNVDFVKAPSLSSARLYVIQYPISGGYRAVAVPWGNAGGAYPWDGIYLNSNDNRPWTRNIVKRVVGHEFGHMYGWGHSSNTGDLMHSNVGVQWWSQRELDRWAGIFGRRPEPVDRHNDDLPTDVDGDGDTDLQDYRVAAWYYEWIVIGGPKFDRQLQNQVWLDKRPGKTEYPDVNGDGVLRNNDLERIVRVLLDQ